MPDVAPALASVHCFQPGAVFSWLHPDTDEHCLVEVVTNHTVLGALWHTVQDVHKHGPPCAVPAKTLQKPDIPLPENANQSDVLAKGKAKGKGTQGPKHKARVKGIQSQKTGVPGAQSTATAPALGSAQETTESDESESINSKNLLSALTGVLKYKTSESAGSSTYKLYLREHPGDLVGARKACKAASAEYRRLQGPVISPQKVKEKKHCDSSHHCAERHAFFKDRLHALTDTD